MRTQIVTELRELFCGHIGTEYQHLRNRDAALWIRERLVKYKASTHSEFRLTGARRLERGGLTAYCLLLLSSHCRTFN